VHGCRLRGAGIRGILKKPSREVGKAVESFGGWTGGLMDESGGSGGVGCLGNSHLSYLHRKILQELNQQTKQKPVNLPRALTPTIPQN